MTPNPAEEDTFKIISWPDKPDRTRFVSLDCEGCDEGYWLEIGADGPPLMASKGLGMFFDIGKRPENLLPREIQCRGCGKVFDNGWEG